MTWLSHRVLPPSLLHRVFRYRPAERTRAVVPGMPVAFSRASPRAAGAGFELPKQGRGTPHPTPGHELPLRPITCMPPTGRGCHGLTEAAGPAASAWGAALVCSLGRRQGQTGRSAAMSAAAGVLHPDTSTLTLVLLGSGTQGTRLLHRSQRRGILLQAVYGASTARGGLQRHPSGPRDAQGRRGGGQQWGACGLLDPWAREHGCIRADEVARCPHRRGRAREWKGITSPPRPASDKAPGSSPGPS